MAFALPATASRIAAAAVSADAATLLDILQEESERLRRVVGDLLALVNLVTSALQAPGRGPSACAPFRREILPRPS